MSGVGQHGVWAHVVIDTETHEPRLLTDAELEEAGEIGLPLERLWIAPGPSVGAEPQHTVRGRSDG